jgi:hypothetical protein
MFIEYCKRRLNGDSVREQGREELARDPEIPLVGGDNAIGQHHNSVGGGRVREQGREERARDPEIPLVGGDNAGGQHHNSVAGGSVREEGWEELARDPEISLVGGDNAGGQHHNSVAGGSVLRTPVPFGGVQGIPPAPHVHQNTRPGMFGRRVPTVPPRGFPLEAAGSSRNSHQAQPRPSSI